MLSGSFAGKLIKMSWDLRMKSGGKRNSRKEKGPYREPCVRYRGEGRSSRAFHRILAFSEPRKKVERHLRKGDGCGSQEDRNQ